MDDGESDQRKKLLYELIEEAKSLRNEAEEKRNSLTDQESRFREREVTPDALVIVQY